MKASGGSDVELAKGKPRPDRAFLPSARQGAMLIARLVEAKQEDRAKENGAEGGKKPVRRCRLSEMTMRRVLHRRRIPPEFVFEVQEWLFRAGWVLFFAENTYALVKSDVVQGWGRISSKRIQGELAAVARGRFNFDRLEPLLLSNEDHSPDEESG